MITHQHVKDSVLTEDRPHNFVTEASTLSAIVPEFRTGWPLEIETKLGNGRPFLRHARCYRDPNTATELLYVRYVQDCGCIELVVYND